MITEVSIRCQKNPEVGNLVYAVYPRIPPQYTTAYSTLRDPLAQLRALLLNGRNGRGGKVEGREGKGSGERGRRGKGRGSGTPLFGR